MSDRYEQDRERYGRGNQDAGRDTGWNGLSQQDGRHREIGDDLYRAQNQGGRYADGGSYYGGSNQYGGGMGQYGEQGQHAGRGPKGYKRSDERIREDISERLTHDSWVDASEIEIEVKEGEVTMTGTVNSREEKRRAEDAVEKVSGVRDIHNMIRVQGNQVGITAETGRSGTQQMAKSGAGGKSGS